MKKCIILGNGLSALSAEIDLVIPVFGMNYAPMQPDYYVCIDTDILLNHSEEIYPLAAGAKTTYLSSYHDKSSKLYDLPNVRLVNKDMVSFKAEQFMSGFTCAYVALKCAYYMGFDEVHLWGIDHSPNWEHYRNDYPPTQTTIARMMVMEWHYKLAAQVYARAGRRIFNHSNPSRLDAIFQRG